MAVYGDILATIGGTPMVELARLARREGVNARIIAKIEARNPGGSTKDRAALYMIRDAEAAGALRPGMLLVEPTSGNTGLGLALAAAVLGYRLVLTMPDTMSIERRKLAAAYGADIVLTPGAEGMRGAVEAAERIARELIDMGVDNYTLNIGGNIRTIGTKANGDGWVAGIQNPDTKSPEQYLLNVQFSDLALVTSGSYQRYYYVGEQKYHHIIDPDTLMPKDVFTSVSILCPDSGVADALSTACFNLSLEDGMKLINSLENTEAMWVEPDGTLHFSDGFEAFVISEESK